MYKYIIVGSGPSGVSAANVLQGKNICLLDVGNLSDQPNFPFSSLGNALDSGDVKQVLGPNWELIKDSLFSQKIHSKTRAAGLRHVLNGELCNVFDEISKINSIAGSYAAGGMSNIWGAQLLRYTDSDLSNLGDWPIFQNDLDPYYSSLESHIGISGINDDMQEYFGSTRKLLPAIKITPCAQYLLNNYNKGYKNGKFVLGFPRLALLTKKYRGYNPHSFGELEFFTTQHSGVYTAKRTLFELKNNKSIDYINNHKVISYKEKSDYVEVVAIDLKDNRKIIFKTKHLLIGAGTIHTAKLVLTSNNNFEIKLPFIDHLPQLLPLFIPKMFGFNLPKKSYPIQLTASFDKTDFLSLYYPGGLLRSDFLSSFPLPLDLSLRVLPYLLSGIMVAQIWEPTKSSKLNYFKLNKFGDPEIYYPDRKEYSKTSDLLGYLRNLGAYSLKNFSESTTPGWGFHYVGTLPMRNRPGLFETYIDGRLYGSKRVRIIDGSVIPSLPAKNHSFTIMANASRIADETIKCGY